jgi:molybdate transport system substrate-binding protein
MRFRHPGATLLIGLFLIAAAAGARPAVTLAQVDPWDCDADAPAASSGPAGDAGSAAAVDVVPFPENPGTLTVFAAASLTDAFTEVESTLEAANPGLDIVNNFAGSRALVTQLIEGAPADVAAFASNPSMDDAIDAGVVTAEPQPFAQNRLTIVVPTDNPAGIASAADLAKPDIKIVLAQEAVPVGDYARRSLCAMGADSATYGDDFVATVAGNIVSLEDNVRSVLSKVALGEADAGIVYTSDVTEDVIAIPIPDEVNELATYPIAPIATGNQHLASAYISYILSPEGQAILASYGFIPIA